MKKLLAVIVALLCCVSFVACAKKDSRIEAVVEAEKMTYEELVAKAKEEVGDNEVVVYGNSSQLVKALEAFTQETGIKVSNVKEGDADLYNHLSTAFQSGQYICDMALLQDGNLLQTQMLDTGYMTNYIPKDTKAYLAEDDQTPLAAVYLNKIFMYNNTNGLTNYITNVWQLAGTAEDAGHISNPSFKTPSTENVNMNFLAMLTSDTYVAQLKEAYKAYYGKDYVEESAYQNIGYKWIAEFLTNCQFHSSDGTACKNVAKGASGTVALVNFNKIKDLKETTGAGSEDKANLSYPAIELGTEKVAGFAGFCYKMYAMVATNAKYPYAACALVNYITTKAGFENAWGSLVGYYSTNTTVTIATGDRVLSWWKERLVVEDPAYVASVYRDITMFVAQYENK